MQLAETATIDLFAESNTTASSEPTTFSKAPAQATTPRATAPATEDLAVAPALPRSYTAFWRGYLASLTAACDAITAAGLTAPRLWSTSKRIGPTPKLDDMLVEARDDIVREIRERAAREFAPRGVLLTIDEDLYKPLLKAPLTEFDPDAVWNVLEAAYGGEKGQEHGLRQTAEHLVKSMSLRYTTPTHLKGRLDVKAQSWSEVRFNGKRQLTYTHCNTVFEALAALQGFCEWAEDQDTADAIRAFTRANRCYDIEVPQHSTFGAIGFRTRVSSITWSFTGAIADKFQAFISEFGQEALAPRD